MKALVRTSEVSGDKCLNNSHFVMNQLTRTTEWPIGSREPISDQQKKICRVCCSVERRSAEEEMEKVA
jgi:uncharacterized protein YifE (UPF0438 family)